MDTLIGNPTIALHAGLDPRGDLVGAAKELATRAHANQTDKAGHPYIEHPAAVAELLLNTYQYRALPERQKPFAVALAWLHDVIEDNDHSDIITMLEVGFPARLLIALNTITHVPHEARDTYLQRVAQDPIAAAVKVADTLHNMDHGRLSNIADPVTRARLEAKYTHAYRVLSEGVA